MSQRVEATCMDCNHFFPATLNKPTAVGICLQDTAFDPYIDELFEDRKSPPCQALVEEKKFMGDNSACPQFDEVDQGIEIDDDSALGKIVSALIDKGVFSKESFEAAVLEEQFNQMDLKTLPIDGYLKDLNDPDPQKQEQSVTSLGSLASLGNDKAHEVLYRYFQDLPEPASINDVHFICHVFKYLREAENKTRLIPAVIDRLYQTPSNNMTRQLISELFRFLESCPPADVRAPVEKMLTSRQFSYRLKQKMKSILAR